MTINDLIIFHENIIPYEDTPNIKWFLFLTYYFEYFSIVTYSKLCLADSILSFKYLTIILSIVRIDSAVIARLSLSKLIQ